MCWWDRTRADVLHFFVGFGTKVLRIGCRAEPDRILQPWAGRRPWAPTLEARIPRTGNAALLGICFVDRMAASTRLRTAHGPQFAEAATCPALSGLVGETAAQSFGRGIYVQRQIKRPFGSRRTKH